MDLQVFIHWFALIRIDSSWNAAVDLLKGAPMMMNMFGVVCAYKSLFVLVGYCFCAGR